MVWWGRPIGDIGENGSVKFRACEFCASKNGGPIKLINKLIDHNSANILGQHGISIEALNQQEPDVPGEDSFATIIMLTHDVIEGNMNDAIAQIEALATVAGSVTRIRVERLTG